MPLEGGYSLQTYEDGLVSYASLDKKTGGGHSLIDRLERTVDFGELPMNPSFHAVANS